MLFLTVGSTIAAFYLWKQEIPVILDGRIESSLGLIVPILVLVGAACFFGLSALFVRRAPGLFASAGIAMAAPYLLIPSSQTNILALALCVCLTLFGAWRMREAFRVSVHFTVAKTLKYGIPLFFTASAITVSMFYLDVLQSRRQDIVSALLPKSLLTIVLGAAGDSLQRSGLPRLNPEALVDDAIADFVRTGLEAEGAGAGRVPPDEFAKLVSFQRDEIARRYGIEIRGDERVTDVIYRLAAEQIENIAGPYHGYLPLAGAIAFFFAFKAFTLPLYGLTILLTFLLIRILRAGSILIVEKQTVEVERLTL